MVRVGTPDVELARTALARLGLADISLDAPTGVLTARLGDVLVERVAHALVTDGVRLHELRVERPDLEDLFVSITGEGFDVLG
jgi:ABC-2 type transport system ATP-binding protein